MPNPRNLNYVLGAIGQALIKLGEINKRAIPPIQCITINKQSGFPGEGIGWFIDKTNFKKLTKSQKEIVVNKILSEVFAYPDWDWVLEMLNLQPLQSNLENDIAKAKKQKGKGGESPYHIEFKNYIASNPEIIGLPKELRKGQTEYLLPSADSIDVLFTDKNLLIGIEVKSRISDKSDILRGIFQCVKYKHLIEAEQKIKGCIPESRVMLVLEGKLPEDLISVKNVLGIEIIDKVKNVT